MHTRWSKTQGLRQDDATVANAAQTVGQIDDPRVRCDAGDDRMTDTDVMVGRTVIAREGEKQG
jgi:hypothetical protein